MWSLVCTWTEPSESASGRDSLAQRIADTARAVHLLAGRAPLWQDWGGECVETVLDAASGGPSGALRALVDDLDRGGADEVTVNLHSALNDDLDGPSSTLWLHVRRLRAGVLEWVPLDLADRVLSEPAVARAVLVALAGIWDADAAAWTRSDVDALHGAVAPTGWMTYRAGVRQPLAATARAVLRGVLTGPTCAAADYGPQQAEQARAVLARTG